MSARFLLIDGYNLMHAAGMARARYGPGDLQRCRERLLRHLANCLTQSEIVRTLVIFDAREPPPDRPSRLVIQGLSVLFANPGGDADVAIQQSLAEHPAPRRVMLVSSDRVLQRAARLHQADYVDSEDFIASLDQRRRRVDAQESSDSDEKPSDRLTAAEAEHWSRYFGDVSHILETESRAVESTPPQESSQEDNDNSTGAIAGPRPEPAASPHRRRRRATKPPRKQSPKDIGDLEFWIGIFRGLPEANELSRGMSTNEDQERDVEAWLDDHSKDDGHRKRTD